MRLFSTGNAAAQVVRLEGSQVWVFPIGVEVGPALPFDQDQDRAWLDVSPDRIGESAERAHLASMALNLPR